jgi:Lon protease-like protein
MPYRVASVTVMPDDGIETAELDEAMDRLLGMVRSLVVKLGDNGAGLAQILGSTRKPLLLANRLSAALATDPTDRQRLLETTNPLQRIDRIGDLAGDMLLRADFPEIDFAQVDLSMVN